MHRSLFHLWGLYDINLYIIESPHRWNRLLWFCVYKSFKTQQVIPCDQRSTKTPLCGKHATSAHLLLIFTPFCSGAELCVATLSFAPRKKKWVGRKIWYGANFYIFIQYRNEKIWVGRLLMTRPGTGNIGLTKYI